MPIDWIEMFMTFGRYVKRKRKRKLW